MENLKYCPLESPLIFDTHAHYDDSRFDEFRDELLNSLPRHGVGGIITCGCDGESSKSALSIADSYDYIYAAVGIHPGNIKSGTEISEIKELAKNKKCVAIGEIGLDYYWEKDNREEQIRIFEEQLILADQLNLPVIVHDRDAHADTLEILKKHKPKGVVHCFSGSVEMAEEILKIGMYIGVGGVVTFKNAKKLPEVINALPFDRMLLETDSPYLAPVPFRGKICHSAMIYFTAEKIAELKGITIEEILNFSRKNTKDMFGV